MPDLTERPNSVPWPPLIIGGVVVLALGLHRLMPLPWPAGLPQTLLAIFGAVLACAAVALDVTAIRAFRRHHTTVKPHAAATSLITDGPFRMSRNPLYVSNVLLLTGAGLMFGVAWLIFAALAGALLTRKLAIEREEQHLAVRFGPAWQDYAARTPRWLFFR